MSDGHETLEQQERQAMDQSEWQETLRRHSATQSQRRREEQIEKSKASMAKARAILKRLNGDELQADIRERRERSELFPELDLHQARPKQSPNEAHASAVSPT